MSEHAHQVALFDWANLHLGRMPELAAMYAIPNGGARSKATAGKLKAEGVKAGVPDIVPAIANEHRRRALHRAQTPARAWRR